MTSPNNLLERLDGEQGAEAQVAALKHMISVWVEASFSLFVLMPGGQTETTSTVGCNRVSLGRVKK